MATKQEPSSSSILIKNAIVVTMENPNRIIEDGAVLIEGGTIADVGRTNDVAARRRGSSGAVDKVIDAKRMVAMPGLVDLHFHTAIAKGVNDGMLLNKFLDRFWYPKLRNIRPEEVYWAGLNTYAEAIKSDTTCVNDMYRYMVSACDAPEKIGIRSVLSCDVTDESEGLDTLKDNEDLIKKKNGAAGGRISARVGLEWTPIASMEVLAGIRTLANRHKVGLHVHLNESLAELEMSKKRHGKRPVELAYDMGILGPDCVAAHCVWLTQHEMIMLKNSGVHVSHDPGSNAKLGNGICPAPELLERRINLGLGHEDNECNNTSDLFEAMKWGSIIHRAQRADATLMPAEQMLRMATENGGKALGFDVGRLQKGYLTDLILVSLRHPRLTPVVLGKYSNVVSHLVYAVHGDDVQTSIIDGRIVMENRKLTFVDEDEVIENATKSCNDLLGRIPPL